MSERVSGWPAVTHFRRTRAWRCDKSDIPVILPPSDKSVISSDVITSAVHATNTSVDTLAPKVAPASADVTFAKALTCSPTRRRGRSGSPGGVISARVGDHHFLRIQICLPAAWTQCCWSLCCGLRPFSVRAAPRSSPIQHQVTANPGCRTGW